MNAMNNLANQVKTNEAIYDSFLAVQTAIDALSIEFPYLAIVSVLLSFIEWFFEDETAIIIHMLKIIMGKIHDLELEMRAFFEKVL